MKNLLERPCSYRFWAWVNGGPVKIMLRPGQVLHWSTGGPNDEGWSAEYHTWEHTDEGLTEEIVSDGRDCDGRQTTEAQYIARPGRLMERPAEEHPDVKYPEWHNLHASQHDEYAEAAGY